LAKTKTPSRATLLQEYRDQRARLQHEVKLRAWEKAIERSAKLALTRQYRDLERSGLLRRYFDKEGPTARAQRKAAQPFEPNEVRYLIKVLERSFPRGIAQDLALYKKKFDDIEDFLDDKESYLEASGKQLTSAFEEAGQSALDQVEGGLRFDVLNRDAVAAAKNIPLQYAKRVSAGTKAMVRRGLAQALKNGEGLDQVTERMRRIFQVPKDQTWRAQRIARTETNKVVNLGTLQGYQQSNVVRSKRWLAGFNARDAHAAARGQTVPLNEPFIVGGEPLMYPGDPSGSAGNIINCRCTMTPVVDRRASRTPRTEQAFSEANEKVAQQLIKENPVKFSGATVRAYNKAMDALAAGKYKGSLFRGASNKMRKNYEAGLDKKLISELGLSKKEAKKFREYFQSDVLGDWYGSSDGEGAAAMKDWARRRFKRSKVYYHGRVLKKSSSIAVDADELYSNLADEMEDFADRFLEASAQANLRTAKKATDAMLDYTYAHQQQLMERAKVGTMSAYRGVGNNFFTKRGLRTPKTGAVARVGENNLSSWSTALDEAEGFGDVIMRREVAPREVFMDAGSGNAYTKRAGDTFLHERELVTLTDGPRRLQVADVDFFETRKASGPSLKALNTELAERDKVDFVMPLTQSEADYLRKR